MKHYNEQEYNKLCAEFLGYVNTTPTDLDFNIYENRNGFTIDGKQYTLIEPMSMKFHSDWNWIMEVVEKISNIPDGVGYVFIRDLDGIMHKKQVVVESIWRFLNLYNEQKK